MYPTINSYELEELMAKTDLHIIDVREDYEFNEGHIPDAINMPLSRLTSMSHLLNKDVAYHVVCHSGGRSISACDFLSAKGYNVTNVMGGMAYWKGAVEL